MATFPKGGVLLIGERHGVKAHPRFASCLLDRLASKGDTTLILEQIDRSSQPDLDVYRREHPEDPAGLGVKLRWWERGWPRWPVYLPLFEAAWRARATIVAADNLSGQADIVSQAAAVSPAPVIATMRAFWKHSMAEAHCDLLTPERADVLAEQELTRDASFAAAIEAAPKDGFVIFYGGRAHVRKDASVPLLLAPALSQRPVISIALQEVSEAGKPVDRAKVLAEAKRRYDYVWFAGEAEQGDVCTDLRAKGLRPQK